MSNWSGSDRRHQLPANWGSLRRQVLARDGHRCTARSTAGDRCTETATDVDHIRRGQDHSLDNLRALCSWHHSRKSAAEGAAAAAARRRRIANRWRRSEPHPGAI